MKKRIFLSIGLLIFLALFGTILLFTLQRAKKLATKSKGTDLYEYAANAVVYIQTSYYFQLPIKDKDTLFIGMYGPIDLPIITFNREDAKLFSICQSGTGFIVDSTGLIMTNRHVVSVPDMQDARKVLYEYLTEEGIPEGIDRIRNKIEYNDEILASDTVSIPMRDSLIALRDTTMKILTNYFKVKDYLETAEIASFDRLSLYTFNSYLAFNQEKYEKSDSLTHQFHIESISDDSLSDLALIRLDKEKLPAGSYPLVFHDDRIKSFRYVGNDWWTDFLIWIGMKSPIEVKHWAGIKVGDKVFSAAYNLGLENVDVKKGFAPTFIQGTIMLPPNDDNIMVNASQTHGSSGSPFLDSMGRVIGVLTSGSENVSYINVVPKERAINFLQQYRNEKKFRN